MIKSPTCKHLIFTLCTIYLVGIFSPAFTGECSDNIDNDGDGLVDWYYDLGCYGEDDPTEGGIVSGKLDNGWTVLEPASDSRIIYVSVNDGNDTSDGLSPSTPKKSISAAFALTRPDYPDWILLKRGDTWYEKLQVRNGRSDTEPFVVASYGQSKQRPLLKTGANGGINVVNYFHYLTVIGIHFYAHTRDFNSSEFSSQDGNNGFNLYVRDTDTGNGLLIEDCCFRFYKNNVIQGPGTLYDIVIRRNLVLDNYSNSSHSQGMYTKNVSLILEENIFDHNGWFKQQIGSGNEQDSGQATMYNHNTYYTNAQGVTFRRNMFMRPSSMGNKWTANNGIASARDIIIDNNLYIDGEIGIGIGGNETEPPHRFKNVTITNNVITDIGFSRPTNRTLGWCLAINDWDLGSVTNNLFMHQASQDIKNVYAIHLQGETQDVSIKGNIAHGIISNSELLILTDGSTKKNISIMENKWQCQNEETTLLETNGSLTNYSFANNTYFSKRPQGEWFRVSGNYTDITGWINASGETNAQAQEYSFPDPTRTIEKYHESLGKDPSIVSFISESRKQSKFNWRIAYTAGAVNEWLRSGFGIISDISPDLVICPDQNFFLKVSPHPLYSKTAIHFNNPKGDASINIFTPRGKKISHYSHIKHNRILWNHSNYSRGIYILIVRVNGIVLQRKIILIK